jgi:hypothetical protein
MRKLVTVMGIFFVYNNQKLINNFRQMPISRTMPCSFTTASEYQCIFVVFYSLPCFVPLCTVLFHFHKISILVQLSICLNADLEAKTMR